MLRFILKIFLITIISINSAFAQVNISFGNSGVSHEDTLYIGDTIHFNFWIINQSNSILTDSLSIECETFDFNNNSISSMSIGEYYNTNLSLDVGDSLSVSISEVVTYASYVLGDNIIVIWPAFTTPGNVPKVFNSYKLVLNPQYKSAICFRYLKLIMGFLFK